MLFAILAGETSSWDREKLRAVSLEAKCQGITLFMLALGREHNGFLLIDNFLGKCDQGTEDTVQGPCSTDLTEGECQDYTLKWHYSNKKQACQEFWCGGCVSRFQTKEECEAQCVPTPL
ncbi:Collagen Alpha-1(Vii) Chain [Manis pentadactyla]|nr:Collagen Alpha-1(Vii) Chain [Manis pentadactyla]